MPPDREVCSITPALIEGVLEDLEAGRTVHRRLPFDGVLHLERHLPFLAVYRSPRGRPDPGTERLVRGEAAYLVAADRHDQQGRTAGLLEALIEALTRRFGSFLILEVWSGAETPAPGEETVPVFRIHADAGDGSRRTIQALEQGLVRIRILKQSAEVVSRQGRTISPPGMRPLLPASRLRALNCRAIGLEIKPIYRAPEGAEVFPGVLRILHRGVARSLRQAAYEFARTTTSHRPRHSYALGPRAVDRSVWRVDRRLHRVAGAYPFLLLVTPVNTQAAWAEFRSHRFGRPPQLRYRPLPVDPSLLKRDLYAIRLEQVEDPTLLELFREKRTEVDRELSMLAERGTANFRYGSTQLYGSVTDGQRSVARHVLASLPGRTHDGVLGGRVTPELFARRARREVRYLRRAGARVDCCVRVTPEVSGLMVSNGDLYIGATDHIASARVEALIQHEIGTHVLTYWNARAQPFQLLASGLAGYDEWQEGLAVLAEYMVGGLTRNRLRMLAGRVLVAHAMENGASFVDSFRLLTTGYDFQPRTAFGVVVRIYRSGGLSKDAVYLRGVLRLLRYLQRGGDLEPLLIGKISERQVEIIRELRLRGVLEKPLLRPRYLDDAQAQKRLQRIRTSHSPLDLLLSSFRGKGPSRSTKDPPS